MRDTKRKASMVDNFKKGSTVLYRTPRMGQEGKGKIVQVIPTARGVWYEVKDSNTSALVRLRAANMELA